MIPFLKYTNTHDHKPDDRPMAVDDMPMAVDDRPMASETKHGVLSHDAALVGDGIILQVPHTWNPPCSCLFAQFFTGEMHALGVVRQELHRTLRMRTPPGLSVSFVALS